MHYFIDFNLYVLSPILIFISMKISGIEEDLKKKIRPKSKMAHSLSTNFRFDLIMIEEKNYFKNVKNIICS